MDTKTEIPIIETPVKPCPICDTMVSLGLIASACEQLPQGERSKCHALMRPLEERRATPADVLADIIVLTGDTNLNAVLDRMNLVIFEATTKAKEKLIAMGRLTKEGFPIEGK